MVSKKPCLYYMRTTSGVRAIDRIEDCKVIVILFHNFISKYMGLPRSKVHI